MSTLIRILIASALFSCAAMAGPILCGHPSAWMIEEAGTSNNFPPGCVGWWTTNDNSYWYEAVSGNNATFDSGVITSNGFNRFTGAFASKADLPSSTYTNLGPNWTICGWVRFPTSGQNNWFFGSYKSTGGQLGYGIGCLFDPGVVALGLRTGSLAVIAGSAVENNCMYSSTNGTVSLDTWHFVAVGCSNWSSSNFGFYGYVDGDIKEMQIWTGESRQDYLKYGSAQPMIGGLAGYDLRAFVDVANDSLRVFTTNKTKTELDTEMQRSPSP